MTALESDVTAGTMPTPAHPAPGRGASRLRDRLPERARDYLALTKPRIISLLLFTSVAGLVIGAEGRPRQIAMLAVLGGGALAAAGANALNCALEGDLDRTMARTRSRPVAGGRITPRRAAGFGILLNAMAAIWLTAGANAVAAALALSGTLWYVVIYTKWLKRRSTQNIVIGGAAGSFPVLVGWSAATGGVDATALFLALVVLLWTPPHFWALATLLRDDYARARVPMLPVVASPEAVARQIRWYAVATLAVSVSIPVWGELGLVYALAALLLGGGFVKLAWNYPSTRHRAAARLFHYSLLYLFLLFLAAGADRVLAAFTR